MCIETNLVTSNFPEISISGVKLWIGLILPCVYNEMEKQCAKCSEEANRTLIKLKGKTSETKHSSPLLKLSSWTSNGNQE